MQAEKESRAKMDKELKLKLKHDKEAEKEKKKEEKREGKKASGSLSVSGGANVTTPESKKGKISGFVGKMFKGKKDDNPVSPGRDSPIAIEPECIQ